jgi:hypothetical protein
LETHIATHGSSQAFSLFVEKAILWSDVPEASQECPYRFNLLDTFFSDSIPDELLVDLFKRSNSRNPGRILIVDPSSPYAEARAASIGGATCMQRSRSGLEILTKSMKHAMQEKRIQGAEDIDPSSLDIYMLANQVRDLGRKLDINVRFYSVVPSGPLYFFRDILICGRFCAGSSAIDLPWSMIVDDPGCEGDQYDLMLDEYDYIWGKGYESPRQRTILSSSSLGQQAPSSSALNDVKIFISHATEDASIASAFVQCIEECLVMPERSVIRCTSMPGYMLSPGETADEVLRSNLEHCDVVIGILTQASLSSTYVMMELGAAWGLKKTTCALMVPQMSYSNLPGPFARVQAVRLDSDTGIYSLLQQISATADLRMRENLAKLNSAVRRFVGSIQ